MTLPFHLTAVVAALAAVFGIFFGLNAPALFGVRLEGATKSFRFHQFLINFLGCVVGWIAVWILLRSAYPLLATNEPAKPSSSDLVLGFIAFLGITGYIPYTAVGIIEGIKDLGKKVLDKATG